MDLLVLKCETVNCYLLTIFRTESLIKALKYKHLFSVQLIAVSINSPGGSLTQAKNINLAIKNFSRQTGAPIFTFAEDACLSAANSILAAGNRSFANEFSLVGDYAFNMQTLGFKDLINAHNISVNTVTAGQNKAKLNMFEDLKEEDKKWVYHMLYEHEYELKNQIINSRGNTFHQLGLKNEDLENKIFRAPVLTSQDALKLGVIDGVSTLERVLNDKYHGVKVAEIMKAHTPPPSSPKNQALVME